MSLFSLDPWWLLEGGLGGRRSCVAWYFSCSSRSLAALQCFWDKIRLRILNSQCKLSWLGFEPGLMWLRVQRSTTELSRYHQMMGLLKWAVNLLDEAYKTYLEASRDLISVSSVCCIRDADWALAKISACDSNCWRSASLSLAWNNNPHKSLYLISLGWYTVTWPRTGKRKPSTTIFYSVTLPWWVVF